LLASNPTAQASLAEIALTPSRLLYAEIGLGTTVQPELSARAECLLLKTLAAAGINPPIKTRINVKDRITRDLVDFRFFI